MSKAEDIAKQYASSDNQYRFLYEHQEFMMKMDGDYLVIKNNSKRNLSEELRQLQERLEYLLRETGTEDIYLAYDSKCKELEEANKKIQELQEKLSAIEDLLRK